MPQGRTHSAAIFMERSHKMTTEEKNKVRQRFLEMLEELEDGELHEVPLIDESEEKDENDDAV